MKQNMNLNHESKTIEEAMENSPSDYASMLKVLMIEVTALNQPRGEAESKKAYYTRSGFMLGTVAAMALTTPIEELDTLQKSSGIVEKMVETALNENSMMAWAKAVQEMVIGKKASNPEAKVEIIRIDKDKAKIIKEKFDNLPDEFKQAIKEIMGSK